MTIPPSWGHWPTQSAGDPNSRQSDWIHSAMPSLYELVLSIQRHLGIIEGRQNAEAAETRRHLSQQDVTLNNIETRLTAVEQRPTVHIVDPPRQAPTMVHRAWVECRLFLAAVASPKEWTIGAVLVFLTVKGIVAPEDARRLLFAVIGLPPI